jgi:hypothetical protein
VHAKAIALVGLSLQESWNVPNAELIMYYFCTPESANGFCIHFCLIPVGIHWPPQKNLFDECKRVNVMTRDLMDESHPTR